MEGHQNSEKCATTHGKALNLFGAIDVCFEVKGHGQTLHFRNFLEVQSLLRSFYL